MREVRGEVRGEVRDSPQEMRGEMREEMREVLEEVREEKSSGEAGYTPRVPSLRSETTYWPASYWPEESAEESPSCHASYWARPSELYHSTTPYHHACNHVAWQARVRG